MVEKIQPVKKSVKLKLNGLLEITETNHSSNNRYDLNITIIGKNKYFIILLVNIYPISKEQCLFHYI